MFKYSAATLKKIEDLLKEAGYIVRYEKGNFVSGFCLLEQRKVIVINKYFETEARINALLEILSGPALSELALSEASRGFLAHLQQQTEKA